MPFILIQCCTNLPPGDVGLCNSQHVYRGLVESEEDPIVDLAQAE